MQLMGRSLLLRPIVPADLETLWRWRNDPGFMRLCSVRREAVSLEAFRQELLHDFETDRHDQFMIMNRGGDLALGTIYTYNANFTDGHIFFSIFICPQHARLGFGAQAGALLLKHLFETLDCYKIYAEAYAYNEHSLGILHQAGFQEEGRFHAHRLVDGRRWELIRLALYRAQLPRIERFVARLTRTAIRA